MVEERKLPGRFRLLQGSHTVVLWFKAKDALPEAPKFRVMRKYRFDGTGEGNVIVANQDLEYIHNGIGNRKRKFEYIGPARKGDLMWDDPARYGLDQYGQKVEGAPKVRPEKIEDPEPEVEPQPDPNRDEMEFNKFTIAELRKRAEAEEVELSGANNKSEIVARFEQHYANLHDPNDVSVLDEGESAEDGE